MKSGGYISEENPLIIGVPIRFEKERAIPTMKKIIDIDAPISNVLFFCIYLINLKRHIFNLLSYL